MVVSALKEKYTLSLLLYELDLPRSSCFYQISVMKQQDKMVISEKLIRKIMKEEFLVVCFVNKRKYQSHQGEISPEVENNHIARFSYRCSEHKMGD